IQTANRHTETIHTTANHRFWDDTTHAWTVAGRLDAGHVLNTNSREHPRIAAVHTRSGSAKMYNLTVQQLHTYYVEAGTTPVLVHNSGPCNLQELAAGIDIENLTMTNTVSSHAGLPVKKGSKRGRLQRPFMGRNDGLLLREIMAGSEPRLDPRQAPNALRW